MRKTIDLTGEKFGRLTVIKRAEDAISDKGIRTKCWECICDCGNKTIVRQAGLQGGTTKSCGCLHREIIGNMSRKHGLSNNCGRLYPL